MDLSIELVLSASAIIIALYSVLIQRKELQAQNRELSKSAEANEKSQQALNEQNQLQSLALQLQSEIHLHEFNNRQEISSQQKHWAKKNFERIKHLQEEIEKITTPPKHSSERLNAAAALGSIRF